METAMTSRPEKGDTSYRNPVQVSNEEGRAMDAADPFVLRHNGRYYLYTTGRAEICVYESEDLVHWTFRGYCTQGEGWKTPTRRRCCIGGACST